jgi:hypothetical protein
MRVETVLPAGPPPMTTTSTEVSCDVETISEFLAMCGVVKSKFEVLSSKCRELRAWNLEIGDERSNLFPVALARLVRLAGSAEQDDEIPQIACRQMAELSHVALADRFLQRLQQGDSRRGDPNPHDAPVVGGTVAVDEPALFESSKARRRS